MRQKLLNSVIACNYTIFSNALKKASLEDVFKEDKDSFSVWHQVMYEPVTNIFLEDIVKHFKKSNQKIDMDIAVKHGDHKGRTAYMIAAAFGMKNKMKYLIKLGADASIVNKVGKKQVSSLLIAEEFFGKGADFEDPSIVEMVKKHVVMCEKKNIKSAINKNDISNKPSYQIKQRKL